MSGARRALLLLVVAVVAASCGAPTFTSKKQASSHRELPRTQPSALPTKIGDAVTLDRTTATPPTTAGPQMPPGTSFRWVDGLELVLQANEKASFRQGEAVHLVLSITNKTGRPVGYLTNRERHFALMDESNNTLWTDEQCRAQDTATTVGTGYVEIEPGDHISIDDYYPTHPGTPTDGCRARAGRAYLTGSVTVCLNLAADWSCRGASAERVQATPIAVTVS